MSKVFKCLVPALCVLLVFQVGKNNATLNFFHGQLYIPFLDYLWKFEEDCQVGCNYFSFKCFFPASLYSVCRDHDFMHECCEQFTSTTTTTTTSTTTPSTTTSTEDPPMEQCHPTPPEMCQPEPGCSVSSHYPVWNQWFRQAGCEHKCWEHCYDQCACKTAANGNCEFHPSSGLFLARRSCDDMSFKESDCRRENSFYSIGGLVCHNEESSQTNCSNGTTIFAVNINGEAHTDKRGIFYMADDDELYEDEYNTRMENDEMSVEIEDDDEMLYGTYAYGIAKGTNKGQCLEYSIIVENDSDFELAVRTLEPLYKRVGERIFSLTLNKVPIALHVDLRALSNQDLSLVDIVASFKIATIESNRRILTVKGHRPIDYMGNLQIGLCISDCQLCEEYNHLDPGYVGSGISVVRF